MTGESTPPTSRFIRDLAAIGVVADLEGPRVMYDVVAIGGAHSGATIRTGVSVSELQNWPLVPPHWVHLPDWIQFAQTNSDSIDCAPGSTRHSREFTLGSTSIPPALSWIRHVRGLISTAIPRSA